ncbi:MAG: Lar family restriction alleviation protein [Pseudoxanthomonas sp.]|nr:Lar family restriction alleviation protein [Pseudoxanthomonas sp.]
MTTDHKQRARELLPCPFCGGEPERIDFGPEDAENAGGSCIACTRCQSSGPVEFGYKENFVSTWNRRAALAQAAQQESTNQKWIDRAEAKLAAQQAGAVPEGWRDDVELAAQMLTWGWDSEGMTYPQECEVKEHQAKLFAMLSAAQPAPSGGWRSMDSAPTKGTFLVFGGTWVGESKDGAQREVSEVCMVNRTHGRSKFYVANSDEFWPWIEDPTHWQPLPPAPVKQEGSE